MYEIPDLFYSECKHPKTVSVAHVKRHDVKSKKKKEKRSDSCFFVNALTSHFGRPFKNKHKCVS